MAQKLAEATAKSFFAEAAIYGRKNEAIAAENNYTVVYGSDGEPIIRRAAGSEVSEDYKKLYAY
jgi:hypothetical protein